MTITAPTDLAGCVLWLDAADTATITSSGGAVSAWANKGSWGGTLDQGTGAEQPQTGTRTLNGRNVLDFDGGDRLVKTTGVSFNVNTMTQFGVFMHEATGFRRVASFHASPGEDYSGVEGCGFGVYGDSGVFYDSGQRVSGAVYGLGTARLLTIRRDGATWSGRMDQAAVTGGSSVTTNFNPVHVEAGGGGSEARLDGILAEHVMYNVALSDADILDVEAYLYNKWFVADDPSNLAVSITDDDATLTWDASTTTGVTTYSVFRRSPQTGADFNPQNDSPIATGQTSPYVDSNLADGRYDWQVFGEVH